MTLFNIEATSNFPAALSLLGLQMGDNNQLSRRLAVTGMINCLPLWQAGESAMVVLRYDPGNNTPVVAIADILARESVQIASSIKSAVPVLFVRSLLNCDSEKWDQLRDNGEDSLRSIVEVDKLLGGNASVSDFIKLLNDTSSKESLCFDLDGEDIAEGVAKAVAILETDEPRCRYQKIIADVLEELWIPNLFDVDLGVWTYPSKPALSAIASPAELQDEIRLWVSCIQAPTNQDEEWANSVGLSIHRKSAADEYGAQLRAVTRLVDRVELKKAGTFAPVVQAMAKEGENYDGTAHLNLIESLVDSGEFQLAWNASLSAGFWICKSRDAVPNEMMLLQGKIARDHFPKQLWPVVRTNLLAMGFSADVLDA